MAGMMSREHILYFCFDFYVAYIIYGPSTPSLTWWHGDVQTHISALASMLHIYSMVQGSPPRQVIWWFADTYLCFGFYASYIFYGPSTPLPGSWPDDLYLLLASMLPIYSMVQAPPPWLVICRHISLWLLCFLSILWSKDPLRDLVICRIELRTVIVVILRV